MKQFLNFIETAFSAPKSVWDTYEKMKQNLVPATPTVPELPTVNYTIQRHTITGGVITMAVPDDLEKDKSKRACFVFFPGVQETGSTAKNTLEKATHWGPLREIARNGKIGSVTVNGKVHNPIYIVYQHNTLIWRGTAYPSVIDFVKDVIDRKRIHVSGISLGGKVALEMMSFNQHEPKTIFAVSPGSGNHEIRGAHDNHKAYIKSGGHFAMTYGAKDTGIFFQKNFAHIEPFPCQVWTLKDGYTTEGHGGWDVTYSFAKKFPYLGNMSYYEWALSKD